MDTRCDLQRTGEPVFGGLKPANEMRSLFVLFEGLDAGIDFVEVQAVLVLAVLDHVEQQTRGKRQGSPIKRTEVKGKYSFGPENQVFSPREKPLF